MRPYQIWRHRLGTDAGRRRARASRSPTSGSSSTCRARRSEQWIVIEIDEQDELEAWLIPRRRPGRPRRRSCGPASPDVEYAIDHWGDRFVVLTNLDAAGLPGDDRAARRARRVDRARPPRRRPADHVGRAVRRPPRRARVARRPAAGARAVPRRAPRSCSTSATSRTTSSSTPTPSGTPTSVRLAYQSLTTPASVYEHDVVTGERTLLKQTPTPNVDLDRSTSSDAEWATAADGTRGAGRHRAPRRHAADGRRPCAVYGYGSYEVVAAAVVLRRPAVAARPRRGVGARPPARRRRARPALVPRRQAARQAQHVHRHHRLPSSTSSPRGWARPGAGRRPRRQRRRAARRRVHDDAARPVRQRRRRGAVRRRRHHDERPDAAADGHRVGGVGRPARGAVRQLHARLLARTTTPVAADVSRRCTSRPGSTIRGSATTSRRSGWPSCARSARASDRPLMLRTEMGAGHGGPSGRYDVWRDEARVLTFLLATLLTIRGSGIRVLAAGVRANTRIGSSTQMGRAQSAMTRRAARCGRGGLRSSGRLDHAPKQAHGGCRPSTSWRAISTLNATSSDDGGERRPAACAIAGDRAAAPSTELDDRARRWRPAAAHPIAARLCRPRRGRRASFAAAGDEEHGPDERRRRSSPTASCAHPALTSTVRPSWAANTSTPIVAPQRRRTGGHVSRSSRRRGSGRGGTAPSASHRPALASHTAYSTVQCPQCSCARTRRACTASRGSAGRRPRTAPRTVASIGRSRRTAAGGRSGRRR